MNLDEPVTRYYPENPYDGITMRQLLTHTSGIPNPMPLKWIHLASEDSDFNSKQFFDEIIGKHNRLKNKPGEKYSYSNIGYLILGRVIENVSGMPYREYIRQNILDKIPLERYEMDFVIHSLEDQARGYQETRTFMNLLLGFFIDKKKYMEGREGKWSAFRPFYVNGSSYGGLIGNARAFSKYLQDLLRDDSKLLSLETRRKMFSTQKLNDGKKIDMGLGWRYGKIHDKEYFYHSGGGGGYYSEMRIYPTLNLATIIMMNRSGMNYENILDQTDEFIFKRLSP
jgi:CubicO group peptidase (beta-lactamase class C family)